jgi:hypothetical protein
LKGNRYPHWNGEESLAFFVLSSPIVGFGGAMSEVLYNRPRALQPQGQDKIELIAFVGAGFLWRQLRLILLLYIFQPTGGLFLGSFSALVWWGAARLCTSEGLSITFSLTE